MSDTLQEQEDQTAWCNDCHGYTHMPWCPAYKELLTPEEEDLVIGAIPLQALPDEHEPAARAITRNWNQKTRVEQIITRHQVWGMSGLPNNEYTASFADVQELRNERERLLEIAKDALRLREEVNGKCGHDEAMTKLCTQCEIRAALNEQKGQA